MAFIEKRQVGDGALASSKQKTDSIMGRGGARGRAAWRVLCGACLALIMQLAGKAIN